MAKDNVKNTGVNVQKQGQDADVPYTGGNTEAERMGRPLEGLFKASCLMLVQKKKEFIGDVKKDGTQDYYYTLSFSDTEELFTCTAGRLGDDLKIMNFYNLGFNYRDKKLKLVDFILLKVD